MTKTLLTVLLASSMASCSSTSNTNGGTNEQPQNLITLTKGEISCPLCIDTELYHNDSLYYYTNDDYGVLTIENPYGEGESFYIYDKQPTVDNTIRLDIDDKLFVVNTDTLGFSWFGALYNEYLIIDEGTSAASRGIFSMNLKTRELTEIELSSYSGTEEFDGKSLSFWGYSSQEVATICPQYQDSCCLTVIEKFTFDVTTKDLKPTGDIMCAFAE